MDRLELLPEGTQVYGVTNNRTTEAMSILKGTVEHVTPTTLFIDVPTEYRGLDAKRLPITEVNKPIAVTLGTEDEDSIWWFLNLRGAMVYLGVQTVTSALEASKLADTFPVLA